ncbi:S8 family peptidase [Lysobacter sp. S4-A87]|uniref:S8 family peptidase n=1 Tax=Lysobacter sp. S4-A87 TaxID=2925843 RepID=UPI001F53D3C6|nr:S8 family peptidase [Lysobacter sp. S4-A87]UNK49125.1 S8 family peptidase [Lysobacter sp. S4-A87]
MPRAMPQCAVLRAWLRRYIAFSGVGPLVPGTCIACPGPATRGAFGNGAFTLSFHSICVMAGDVALHCGVDVPVLRSAECRLRGAGCLPAVRYKGIPKMSVDHSRSFRARCLCAALVIAVPVAIPVSAQDSRLNLSGMGASDRFDRFIVKYRDGSAAQVDSAALQRSLHAVSSVQGRGNAMALKHVHRIATGADVVSVNRKLDRVDAQSLMRQIASDPSVEYVEVDHLMLPAKRPKDSSYVSQWGLHGINGIDAARAWRRGDGRGTVVAVIDSGITRHSDLDGNVLPGYDFISRADVSNDGNGRDGDPSDPGDWVRAGQCGAGSPARDSSWHGTHVAGTIAAVTNNGKGVAGVAPAARIVPVRVLGTCGGFESDIADAIVWASGGDVPGVPANANPAEVINLSLQRPGQCSATFQGAINFAVSRGTTLVVAAGNGSTDVSGQRLASCDNVIVVAATNRLGRRTRSSNHGSKVDIAAPGIGILSTTNGGETKPQREDYGSADGTSVAAPHVAGVVALIQSAVATPKSPAQVEALIKHTASRAKSRPAEPIGAGIVNAKSAVDAAVR